MNVLDYAISNDVRSFCNVKRRSQKNYLSTEVARKSQGYNAFFTRHQRLLFFEINRAILTGICETECRTIASDYWCSATAFSGLPESDTRLRYDHWFVTLVWALNQGH